MAATCADMDSAAGRTSTGRLAGGAGSTWMSPLQPHDVTDTTSTSSNSSSAQTQPANHVNYVCREPSNTCLLKITVPESLLFCSIITTISFYTAVFPRSAGFPWVKFFLHRTFQRRRSSLLEWPTRLSQVT